MVDVAHRQRRTKAAIVHMMCTFKKSDENMSTVSKMNDI